MATFALLALSACSEPRPDPTAPAGPETIALELFELALLPDPSLERIGALFGFDEQRLNDPAGATLLDAISALQPAGPARILSTYPLSGLERLAVDLEVALPEEGLARYSVQLDISGARPTIAWFSGPGVEWPEKTRRDSGLSTSAPPPPPQGG